MTPAELAAQVAADLDSGLPLDEVAARHGMAVPVVEVLIAEHRGRVADRVGERRRALRDLAEAYLAGEDEPQRDLALEVLAELDRGDGADQRGDA